jgi:hypothetical protein
LRAARTAAARAAAEVADGAGATGPGRGNANAGEASSTSPTSTGRSSASGARSTLAARCRSGGDSETASPLPDAEGHEEVEGDDTRSSANGGLESPGSSAAMGCQWQLKEQQRRRGVGGRRHYIPRGRLKGGRFEVSGSGRGGRRGRRRKEIRPAAPPLRPWTPWSREVEVFRF